MTKNEAIGYYHSLMRFGVKPGLDRIRILLDRLGNPQDCLKYIHVAGTNGKGSVCTEISNILRCAGFKTGLYTSPYVIEFSERIQINNSYIADADLIRYTEIVKDIIDELNSDGVVITEFEAITATAFLYFKEQKCDIVVLETGLGGRYDATNVIKSDLCSVITSVSLDHTAILGDTIGKIAYEKCGIFKDECPVVFSPSQSEDFIKVAAEEAEKHNCQIHLSRPEHFRSLSNSITGSVIQYKNLNIAIPFPGYHQIDNTSLVLACIEILNASGYDISVENIKRGIEESFIPARTEIICRQPLIILDGSHNPSSVAALSKIIKEHFPGKKLLGLTAMMKDKDIDDNMSIIAPLFDTLITSESSNPRTAKAVDLSEVCCKHCNSVPVANCSDALEYASEILNNYDLLIVFGSLYFASDLRELLLNKFRKGD